MYKLGGGSTVAGLVQGLEVTCHITDAKVAEAVKQLHSGSAPGLDEI